ncbi:MAG: hypothetical protein GQ564_21745 [Bacteroidales bacterium]|nr:hypothetical protein [Bacteroidales bacterium]
MIKKILFLSFLSFNLIANAQNDLKGLGIGFDFSFHKENRLNSYTYPPFEVKSTTHFNYMPSITYAFNNNSFTGLIFGFGQGESNSFNDIHDQQEYFLSNSTSIGLFYKRNLFKLHNFRAYTQPLIAIFIANQMTSIQNDNGQTGEFITGIQVISSLDFNLRIGIDYQIITDLSIGIFLSNDIISKEKIEVETLFLESSNDWIWFRNYIVLGIGLHYQF